MENCVDHSTLVQKAVAEIRARVIQEMKSEEKDAKKKKETIKPKSRIIKFPISNGNSL